MLLGSVPRPPKKPKSSISTQSARHSTNEMASAGLISRGRPVRNTAPVTASAMTANKLTANPCASSKAVKAVISADGYVRLRGGGHSSGHAGQRAGLAVRTVPCQKPRPGQACSTAMPSRNTPSPAMVTRPGSRDRQARSGSAISTPADAVDEHRARRAEQPGQPRGEDAAERLAECPHHQAPADADQPGQPGQRASCGGEQPDADPDLDPHRRGAGLHRVKRPRGAGPVHHVPAPSAASSPRSARSPATAVRPPSAAGPARSRRTAR